MHFIAGDPSVATSTLAANPTRVVADGKVISIITLQLKDKFGNNLHTSGSDVTMSAASGIGGPQDGYVDGIFRAFVFNTNATIAGEYVDSTVTVSFDTGDKVFQLKFQL